RDRHLPVPHSRTVRHGRRAGARSLPRRSRMKLFGVDPIIAVLVIPLAAAALLALMPAYRITARINVLATWLTLLTALSLLFDRPAAGRYLLVDDLNNVFIVLTTFIGFTT